MNTLIIWILIGLLLLLIAFMPRWGVFAQYRRWRAAAERERIEDALKQLLDSQWQGRPTSLRGLAAALHLSDKAALSLVNRMQAQGLLDLRGNDLLLTTEGERAALQITRAHRLLERYLAYEARMPLEKVHSEAHHLEHTLTPKQVDELDAAMGFPRHDPHGDPIPTAAGAAIGELPVECGTPLTAWETNTPGKIVHLEDEPPLAYAQILAEGLKLAQVVRILEVSKERYVISDGANEYRLAPAVAANVYVEPLAEKIPAGEGIVPLYELSHDQQASIVALDESCQGFTRRRFLDLGLTPGTMIYPELLNAFGDPRAYRVRGTLIALRRDQAAQIWVRPLAAS
jgi:DtxR family Mn-dependent transcriptional regulator